MERSGEAAAQEKPSTAPLPPAASPDIQLTSKPSTGEATSEKEPALSQTHNDPDAPRVPANEGGGLKTPEPAGPRRPPSKNISSGDILVDVKKKGEDSVNEEDAYTVTFTVSIAMAIPTVEDEEQPELKDMLKKKKSVVEAPRPQNYYHLEYYLVPGDQHLFKTDIVTYGMAAKLYMERHDARVIKTWQDGELTWIAWAHSHTMTVTEDLLMKLFDHTLEVRVWDNKDKCSTRARYDRPKAFRLPQPKPGESPEDVGGVKAMVMKQLSGLSQMQSSKADPMQPLPQRSVFPRPGTKKKGSAESSPAEDKELSTGGKMMVSVPNKVAGPGNKSFSRLSRLAGSERPQQGSAGHSSAVKDMIFPDDNSGDRLQAKKAEAAAATEAERAKKFGICVVPFRMALLFSGAQSLTCRLSQAVNGVEDLFITVTLDKPLLSEDQLRHFNPTIITLKSLTLMPKTPLSHQELREKCEPVYCRYKFFKQPMHTTTSKPQAKDIYWEDKNVVLLGTQDMSELREYLSGPAMQVEVHDRDRRAESVQPKPKLFGDDLEDEKISNVGTVTSRRTLHNAMKGRNRAWDPYGVAHVDLSELLLGNRFLELKVPILNCPLPDVLGVSSKQPSQRLMGVAGAVDGPVDQPLPSGVYLRSGATLKIQIELAHPLVTPAQLAAKEELPESTQCPFGRIIFMFDYKNRALLHELQQLIVKINAHALDMCDMPPHVIDAALSTYKLSIEQMRSVTLDIITGFHVLDGERHIFVLEGLRNQGVRKLWEELPQPERSDVRVLYNSHCVFSARLYGPLDVDLCRVKLHQPLGVVVQQALLYIRDMVPRPCFLALTRLQEMTRMHQMKDVVRNDIFPTSPMIISMSREFGVPFTAQDFEDLRPESQQSDNQPVMLEQTPSVKISAERYWTPLDSYNKPFIDRLLERQNNGYDQDFISQNKDFVKRESDLNVELKDQSAVPLFRAAGVKTHNYSTQTLNSTELANELLRDTLQQHKDTNFTRAPEFHHSGTVPPVDLKALAKEEELASRRLWRTNTGWIYPGHKTNQQTNVHPHRPSSARILDLHEPYQGNLCHVGELQSPLDREKFPWLFRHQDMELYVKPPKDFHDDPLSIHSTGVVKEREKREVQALERSIWRRKVVVDHVRPRIHRLLPATEMTDAGFYSSNQIDRLTSMLKDPPMKLAYLQSSVRDIPPLSVVNYPSVDTAERARGARLEPAVQGEGYEPVRGYKPGPYSMASWNREHNRVDAAVYDHQLHAQTHGRDFNAVYMHHQSLHKRPIMPLRETERDNHLFRSPAPPARPRMNYAAMSTIGTSTTVPLPSLHHMRDATTTTCDIAAPPPRTRNMVYV